MSKPKFKEINGRLHKLINGKYVPQQEMGFWDSDFIKNLFKQPAPIKDQIEGVRQNLTDAAWSLKRNIPSYHNIPENQFMAKLGEIFSPESYSYQRDTKGDILFEDGKPVTQYQYRVAGQRHLKDSQLKIRQQREAEAEEERRKQEEIFQAGEQKRIQNQIVKKGEEEEDVIEDPVEKSGETTVEKQAKKENKSGEAQDPKTGWSTVFTKDQEGKDLGVMTRAARREWEIKNWDSYSASKAPGKEIPKNTPVWDFGIDMDEFNKRRRRSLYKAGR